MSSPSTVPFVTYLSSSSPSISMVSVQCRRIGIILNLSECVSSVLLRSCLVVDGVLCLLRGAFVSESTRYYLCEVICVAYVICVGYWFRNIVCVVAV